MKPLVFAGIALVGLGTFVLLRGLSYSSQSSVLKVGDLKVSAEEQHRIPPWVGVIAIIGGVALVGGGVRRRHGT